MSKAFVIPDVHLKPWIFDKAEEYLSKTEYDHIIFLGDIVDDWHQGENLALYEETFDALIAFAGRHPNFLLCYGNHDMSYAWGVEESGYSPIAKDTVLAGLAKLKSVIPEKNRAYIHRIDNVIFSHAGLAEDFIINAVNGHTDDIDELLKKINSYGVKEMWSSLSPIWARPCYGATAVALPEYLQVVAHTPVDKADYWNNVLTVDSFSIYANGDPIGDQRFVWVDTVSKQWGFADNNGEPESLPDPRLDIRYYKVGDKVRFIGGRGDDEKKIEGVVEILNRYRVGDNDIDIRTDGCLYKHVPLTLILEKIGEE